MECNDLSAKEVIARRDIGGDGEGVVSTVVLYKTICQLSVPLAKW